MTSTARPLVRGLLARLGYRRLWTARTVSQVGDVTQFTTLALLLVHLTGSAVPLVPLRPPERAPTAKSRGLLHCRC